MPNIIIIPSLLCLLACCWAGTPDDPLAAAEAFSAAGADDAAVTEYMRWLCFNGDHADVSRVHRRTGESYRRMGLWSEAVEAFRMAAATAATPEEIERARISASATLMAAGEYSAAELELLRLVAFSDIERVRADARLLLCACYVYQYKWDAARRAASGWSVAPAVSCDLDRLLEDAGGRRQKSPAVARWLSTAVPGTGQIYAGEWRDGIHALLVSSAALVLLVDGVLDRQYGDVLFIEGALFERFYRGSRLRSAEAAERRNQSSAREHARRVLLWLNAKNM